MVRKHFFFSGRVQGVGFRYQSAYYARRLGLTGWVRNLSDGRVEMEGQGKPEGVYVRDVETGSPAMEAGFQRADIITYIGDEKITNMGVYRTTLLGQKEGTKILVKGCRQGTGGEYVDIEFDMTVGTNK